MKRGFREVLLGAVSCVATVGAGGGAWLVDANVALAQSATPAPTAAQPSPAATEPAAPSADVGQPAAPAPRTPPAPAPAPRATPARPAGAAPTAPRSAAGTQAVQAKVIRQIQVQGNQRVEASTVISYLSIQ